MTYEIKDNPVHGKMLAQNGKIVITDHDTAMKLAERFNALQLVKAYGNRYMIQLPYTANSIEECDCQANQSGQLQPDTYNQYPDHEVQMARQELYRTAKLAIMTHELLKQVGERQGLEGWVQSKLTRAADYIETVFDYLDYEMRYPSEMYNEADLNLNPGGSAQATPGATAAGQQNLKPGQMPQPADTGKNQTPGMVKMAKVDMNGKIQGQPIMVLQNSIKSKQQAGFRVIGESASAGASSAGGVASGMGFGNGFLNGGPGAISRRPKKKKRTTETTEHDRSHLGPYDCGGADSWYGRRFNPHKYVDLPNGNRQRVELTDPKEIEAYKAGYQDEGGQGKNYGESIEEGLKNPKDNPCWKGYHPVGTKKKNGRTVPNCVPGRSDEAANPAQQAAIAISKKKSGKYRKDGERVKEANYQGWVSNPHARMASGFMHDPDRAATMYKANKYDPETGLGGYIAPRGSNRDDTNIMVQLNNNLDSAYSTPLRFDDGSELKIGPGTARKALNKLHAMRPVQRHEAVKGMVASKDAFVSFVKESNESIEEGWKSAAAGAALMGLGAMGAGGQAQAADMNKAGVTNMKAPVHATQAVKKEVLKRYPTDPRPDLKLGSLEDMFFNGNTNHDREIRFLNYETDPDKGDMTPQQWSDAQGPKNSPMKKLSPDEQAARKKLPLRTANWTPDDDKMPATIEAIRAKHGVTESETTSQTPAQQQVNAALEKGAKAWQAQGYKLIYADIDKIVGMKPDGTIMFNGNSQNRIRQLLTLGGMPGAKIMSTRTQGVGKSTQTTQNTMATKESESGPEFTGYWKGTDKGKPGNKMVGGGV